MDMGAEEVLVAFIRAGASGGSQEGSFIGGTSHKTIIGSLAEMGVFLLEKQDFPPLERA